MWSRFVCNSKALLLVGSVAILGAYYLCAQEPLANQVDLWGDPLPEAAIARLGTRRFRHPKLVTSVAYSRQGDLLATAGGPWVRVWNAASGRELLRVKGHAEHVAAIAISPDEKTLATAGMDDKIRLWQIPSGQLVLELGGHQAGISCIEFSADSLTLASASDCVRLWDVRSGQHIRKFGTNGYGTRVRFQGKEQHLVAIEGDGTIRVWDVEREKEIQTIRLPSLSKRNLIFFSMTFSPDGKRLATTSWANPIRVWQVDTGKRIQTIDQGKLLDMSKELAFSPDGNIIASVMHYGIQLWEATSGQLLQNILGDWEGVNSPTFSPDGKHLAFGGYGLRIVELESGIERTLEDGHTEEVTSLAFSPNSDLLVSGSHDNTVRLWNVGSARELRRFRGHGEEVNAVAFSPDGKVVASAGYGDSTPLGHDRHCSVILWNAATGRKVFEDLVDLGEWVISFSPKGEFLAAAGGIFSNFCVWDLESTEKVLQVKATDHEDFNCIDFSSDGRTVAIGDSKSAIRLWEVPAGRQIFEYQGHSDEVHAVAFSPDGNVLASGDGDGAIRFWDVPRRREIRAVQTHSPQVHCIAFCPSGDVLASGGHSDDSVYLWEVQSGTLLKKIVGHESGIYCLAFSPDGKLLASGAGDSSVLLWDVQEVLAR